MNEHDQERMRQVADRVNAWTAQNQRDGGVCDFCSRLLADVDPVTYVTSKPITETIVALTQGGEAGTISHYADEYWAACPTCDPVIQQKDPVALAKHVVANADYERIGIPRGRIDEERITHLYEEFFAQNPERVEGIPEEALARAEAEVALADIIEGTTIFGFEYPSYEDAKAAYDRNHPLITKLIDEGEEGHGATMWTAQDPTETGYLLLVADLGLGMREKGDWGDGAPYEVEGTARRSLLDRHVGIIAENILQGRRASEQHYGLGAEMRPGNDMRIRVGGDQ